MAMGPRTGCRWTCWTRFHRKPSEPRASSPLPWAADSSSLDSSFCLWGLLPTSTAWGPSHPPPGVGESSTILCKVHAGLESRPGQKNLLCFSGLISLLFFFSPFNVEESDNVAVPSRVPCSSWLRQTPEPGVLGVTIWPGVVALGWGRMGTPGGFGGLLRAATALPQPQEPERGSAGRREVMGPFEKVEGPRRRPWSQLSVCPQLAAP